MIRRARPDTPRWSLRRGLPGKALACGVPCGGAEPASEALVGQQLLDRGAEGGRIARRYDETGHAALDGVDEAADRGRDDGRPCAIASRATTP